MKILIFTFVITITLSCATQKLIGYVFPKSVEDKVNIYIEKALSNNPKANRESFSKFLEKFSSDSEFQLSRVRFPIKNEIYNTDTELYETHFIKKNEWEFSNLKDFKYIMTVKNESDNEKILNIKIEDTGVSVLYYFVFLDGLWYLNNIVDQST